MDPNCRAPAATPDPQVLLLGALAWTCADDKRASRLMDLTGLSPDELRARAAEPGILAALARFLGEYEPDLIACAEALDCTPGDIVAAGAALENDV